MANLTSRDFQTRDVFVYWHMEDAMVRYEHVTEKVIIKFLDTGEELERPHNNTLVADVLLYGVEITKKEYELGVIPEEESDQN